MVDKKRLTDSFIEMIKIHSPSDREKKFADYMILLLKELGAEIYLDEGFKKYGGDAPTIFAKIKGTVAGEGVTLAAHMDVIEPNANVNPVIAGDIIKTDGTTTLGGDDKGGVAAIVEVLRVLKEKNIPHKDIYVLLTPGEEAGMHGAKNIDWSLVPSHMRPAENMIVLDNAGRAGIIAHTAPSKYGITFTFKGKKAHAGIEPEKGINAIALAACAVARMQIGRIDEFTTSNLGKIDADFPSNVVPDCCVVKGELRGHSEEKIKEMLMSYEKACEEAAASFGGEYTMEYSHDYPALKPKDDLKFAREFAEIYESIGVPSELKIIGGGSDSNILAAEGFNSIIIGVGMYDVHTVDEYLDTAEMFKTAEAVLKYIARG